MDLSPKTKLRLVIIAASLSCTGLLVGLIVYDVTWRILCWAVTSMSAFWVLNRMLHAMGSIAGETERDGVVWLLPLSTAVVPVSVFFVSSTVGVRSAAILLWGLLNGIIIQFVRPEIVGTPTYREPYGFVSFMRSLVTYRMEVEDCRGKNGEARAARKTRYSATALLFFGAFSMVASALIHVTPRLETLQSTDPSFGLWIQILRMYPLAVVSFLGIVAAGVYFTYKAPRKRMGWPVQEGEAQILTMVFVLSTFSLIAGTFFWFALPILVKLM